MAIRWLVIGSCISIVASFVSCHKSEYTRLMNRELSKGIRNDSILLGFSFGDSRVSFVKRCEQLNKRQLLVQGAGGYVKYLPMDTTLFGGTKGVSMEFRPTFDDEDVICEMELLFYHSGWAPWNTQFQSIELRKDVLSGISQWYKGNDFVLVVSTADTLYAKIDGNRRIVAGIKDERVVRVKVQDLHHAIFSRRL